MGFPVCYFVAGVWLALWLFEQVVVLRMTGRVGEVGEREGEGGGEGGGNGWRRDGRREGREGGREEGRKGGREGGRKEGRKGGREGLGKFLKNKNLKWNGMELELFGVGDGFEKERGRGRDRGIDRMEWLSRLFFLSFFFGWLLTGYCGCEVSPSLGEGRGRLLVEGETRPGEGRLLVEGGMGVKEPD